MLASKATYLASLIGTDEADAIVADAATSPHADVRVAAASAAANISPEAADPILDTLLNDSDVGVRKLAVRSVSAQSSPEVVNKVQLLSETDEELLLRNLASEALESLNQ